MDRVGLDRLTLQHANFPGVLAKLVEGFEHRTLRARENDQRWSPLEILAHLVDEEIEDFRPRAQGAAAGNRITTPLDPAAWVVERAYNSKDPADVLANFESERRRSCEWLRTLDIALLDNAFDHPRLGRMRCGDFVAAWRIHDLLHLRQLTTALAILTARELEDWRVDYAGQIPAV